ncbi:MAG: ureidoglycolate lyase [Proteobacteria bacterium]|nr:ureidoglycolate lyase [Pseudomonadota bacterium]
MTGTVIRALPITPERFAPYGDVIAALPSHKEAMNAARFERFNDLATVNVDTADGAHAAISLARSKTMTTLPYCFDLMERHPFGSQAFVPLSSFRFVVVVAPPGESVEASDLRAFVTNGHQGVNYHKGVWHMPLIAFEAGQDFLIIDRAGGGNNYEEHILGESVTLEVE